MSSGVLHGVLNVLPEKIQAVDMDTLNSPIRYSFVSGTPNFYEDYFRIDADTGAIHQIKTVDTSTAKNFSIILKVRIRNRKIVLSEVVLHKIQIQLFALFARYRTLSVFAIAFCFSYVVLALLHLPNKDGYIGIYYCGVTLIVITGAI